MTEQNACAHCRVILKHTDDEDGTLSDYWECDFGCGRKFAPAGNDEATEAGMVYNEIHSVCKRYCSEGDRLTVLGVVGALEAVKADILDMLKAHNSREGE
jgi:hypothetical protein